MSLLRRIGRGLGRIARPIFRATPFGQAVEAIRGTFPRAAPVATAVLSPPIPSPYYERTMQRVAPGAGVVGAGAAVIAPAARIGAAGFRAAGRLARSAMAYCRRNPSWCAQVGGTAAVLAMIQRGELPPVKSRRAKGISGTELRAFKRVTKVLDRYCKMPVPTARRRFTAARGKACP